MVPEAPKGNLAALGPVWIQPIYTWREDTIWQHFSHYILVVHYILQWNQMPLNACHRALWDKRPCSFSSASPESEVLNVCWVNNQLMVNEKCLGSIRFLFPCSQLFMRQTCASALLEKDQNGTVPPCCPSLYPVPNHLCTCIHTELKCLSWVLIECIVSDLDRGHLSCTSWK